MIITLHTQNVSKFVSTSRPYSLLTTTLTHLSQTFFFETVCFCVCEQKIID
jgi:hypothetical protein